MIILCIVMFAWGKKKANKQINKQNKNTLLFTNHSSYTFSTSLYPLFFPSLRNYNGDQNCIKFSKTSSMTSYVTSVPLICVFRSND